MDYDRLRELQEKFEENPRRYFAPLANEYRKGGQPKRAIEICRAQLAQMPGHMSGQIVFGQALYESGEFDEARQVFQRALALDPENLIALRSLGDMSLQAGDTSEARSWYMRLLDADPKDTAVIALVSEIDASAEATPVAAPAAVPVDSDAGDQVIPFITEPDGTPIEAEKAAAAPQLAAETQRAAEPPPAPVPDASASERAAPEPSPADTAPESPPAPVAESAPPAGLERHYPVEPEPVEAVRVEPAPVERSYVAPPATPAPPPAPATSSFEDEVPLGAEGLHSAINTEPRGAESLRSLLKPTPPTGTEGLQGKAPPTPPVGTEGLKGKPVPSPLEGARASKTEEETALDNWTPPPGANVHERVESRKEDRMFSGTSPEPFVNETMAQLYLQQGYRQLALKVYYQLAEARPDDQKLKDRIAEIEAADRAAHPEAVAEPRREPPPVERPSSPPVAPRAPSIEAPSPRGAPESEESPSFDRTPIDSPPSRPSRQRESIESPAREEPRAEPEGIAARQPSVKEFFATLGRRRPPRSAPAAGSGTSSGGMRAGNNVPTEPPPAPLATAAPGASLDAVFAGATVNPSDSRAASRLAGAFSGATGGTPRTTPPTPPMPTPRVNPRLPHMQESEEDVAKFRAWLDGLTGE
jgi:tetratricopeptide (TPR) repeat protein